MTIIMRDEYYGQRAPVVIDLAEPEGNVAYIIGWAEELAKIMKLDGDAIVDEMFGFGKNDKNYEEIIKIFEGYFGKFTILIDDPSE
jgi:hypothetical protein